MAMSTQNRAIHIVNRFFIVSWLFLFVIMTGNQTLVAQPAPKHAVSSFGDNQIFAPGEIVIKTLPNVTLDEITTLVKSHGAKILERNSTHGIYRLKVSGPVEKAPFSFQSDQAVVYAKPNYIFAEIGGKFITIFDIELTIHRFIPVLRQRYTQPGAKEKLLRTLLNDKIFSQAARDEGLQNVPEVQWKINEAVDKTLADIYKQRIQTGTSTISEKEMKTYYEKNSEKFQVLEQIRGQRILVNTRQEAEEVLETLETGVDFGKLAREKSIGPSGQKDGTFVLIGRGKSDPAFEKVVFTLQNGEISEIIQTQAGYYIIKAGDKSVSRRIPFSEVKKQIEMSLKALRQDDAVGTKRKELEDKYDVKLNLGFLSEVKVPVMQKLDPRKDIDSMQMLREVINKAIERPY